MFVPSSLPRQAGQLLLVTDKVSAPAEFIILNILASHLKQEPRSKCLLVSFSEAISHWNSVAARLSPPANLTSQASKGSIIFLNALPGPVATSADILQPLFNKIYEMLEANEVCEAYEAENGQKNLLVLDGLSMVEWSGTPTSEAKRFIRALRALCLKRNTALVVRHHRVTINDLDDLTRALLSQCALHLEVLPLTSGRSGTISGEIALHVGPLLEDSNSVSPIPRSSAVQYRLRDSGPVYFGRGTGVL